MCHKVSVVTVVYNSINVIEDTLLSVINQSYSNVQYIVIDGCSNDGTYELVCKYADKIDIIIHEKDNGIFDAMNKSLNYVEGDYVLFLNSGDRFVNNSILSSIFENKKYSADIIYGDVYTQTIYGYNLIIASSIYNTKPTPRDLVFKSQGFSHQSLFTKSIVLKEIGFNVNYPIGADYDTTYKVYKNGNHECIYVGSPISIFDRRTGGFSNEKIISMYRERLCMFGYDPKIFDVIKIYYEGVISFLKSKMRARFPFLINKNRYKRYL